MGAQTLPFGEKKYPLDLVKCPKCHLVQLKNSVPQSEMYNENYGYRSGINETIKADLEDIVSSALKAHPKANRFLDIGCNDGTLLSYYGNKGLRIGWEPVKKLADVAQQYATAVINDYWSYDRGETFDIITVISCFYDMPDPNKFVEDLASSLEEDGLCIIQQNYLLRMLENNAYDNICHEHLEYYSLLSLENLLNQHGLEVFRVEENSINGGSLRTYICHKGQRPVEQNVSDLRAEEKKARLDTKAPYEAFANRVEELSNDLRNYLDGLKNVYAYGASTRGSVIVQKSGIKCDAVVERNPDKFGKDYHGMKVITEQEAKQNPPDYALILPYFHKSIAHRVSEQTPHAKIILPLPRLQELSHRDLFVEQYL